MLPLHLAAQNGHTTVVNLLLGHRNKRDVQSKGQMVNAKDQVGQPTSSTQAASRGGGCVLVCVADSFLALLMQARF